MPPSNYGWPTSRCFPRTTDDAFKHLGEGSQWWYPPEQRWQDKLMLAVSVAMWLGIAIYFWKTI